MTTKVNDPTVSIVFSFRNEEEVLPELIRRARSVMRELHDNGHVRSWEMIFVDDDSDDRSEQILREHSVGHGDIRVVTTTRPFGKEPCNLAGMKHASGDLVIYLDADLQDPPEIFPQLLAAWRDDPQVDVVHTVRKSRAGESRPKLWATAIAYRILNVISDVDLPIEAGDFKLVSRRAVQHLVELREHRPYVRGLISWIGFKSTKVYYDREPRFAGDTKVPTLGIKVIRHFLDSALISFSDIPLKLSILFGIVSSALALLYTVWIVVEKVRGHNLPGWSALMVAVLFMGGVQLLSIGVLGLYISSIFVEVKSRPPYIVKGRFGFPEEAVEMGGRNRDRFESNYVH